MDAMPTRGCNSRTLIEYFSKIEESCLHITSDDGTNPHPNNLERILATNSSSTQDFMARLAQIQAQDSDKTSKYFKKNSTKEITINVTHGIKPR